MDIMGFLTRMWENHRNASIGVIIGLLVGLCFVSFGFCKTVVVAVCLLIGLLLGRLVDKDGGWKGFVKKFKNNE